MPTYYNSGAPGTWPDPTDASQSHITALGSTTPRTAAARAADVVNIKDFGAVGDGVTDDTAAMDAITIPGGNLLAVPTLTAYQYGLIGPATGVYARADVATIGVSEKLANGEFTGSAAGWTLSNFTYGVNAISHTAGTVGDASQSITLKAYRQYRLAVTLTTTTKGLVGFFFGADPLLDSDFINYTFDVASALTFVFNCEFRSSTTTASFHVTTDTAWEGSIDSVSLIEVADELPLSSVVASNDDPTLRNPHGLKFGRYNAGQYFLGDRQTGAFHQSAGVWNIGIGARALSTNETGFENVAVGPFALKYTASSRNTAYGYSAAKLNTLGEKITALGYKALVLNTTGSYNTGVGFHAGFQNTTGSQNTAVGFQALYDGLADSYQTAVGSQAGTNARGGTQNLYVGALAGLLNANANVTYAYSYTSAVGSESKVYGNNGTALGYLAKVGADGSPVNNATALGSGAVADRANSVQIGNSSVTSARVGDRVVPLITVSADRGDTNQTLTVNTDSMTQRWATTLTANRTVTLSTTGAANGDTFRVVRTGLGAFTLDVGGLKTIPSATAAYVDVAFDGTAWILTGFGAL